LHVYNFFVADKRNICDNVSKLTALRLSSGSWQLKQHTGTRNRHYAATDRVAMFWEMSKIASA